MLWWSFTGTISRFLKEIHGGELAGLDESQLIYKVPFFIWTNYESGSREISLTSLNYLSNYVFETAGTPLPPYNRFLREIEQTVPVMNAAGYYSRKQGGFIPLSQADGEEEDVLGRYWTAEYNSLFDPNHTDQIFFPLTE
jgi:hypothetical protein